MFYINWLAKVIEKALEMIIFCWKNAKDCSNFVFGVFFWPKSKI
jgi:hypothetical protein